MHKSNLVAHREGQPQLRGNLFRSATIVYGTDSLYCICNGFVSYKIWSVFAMTTVSVCFTWSIPWPRYQRMKIHDWGKIIIWLYGNGWKQSCSTECFPYTNVFRVYSKRIYTIDRFSPGLLQLERCVQHWDDINNNRELNTMVNMVACSAPAPANRHLYRSKRVFSSLTMFSNSASTSWPS